jgi:CheY-like chemotaxis protein
VQAHTARGREHVSVSVAPNPVWVDAYPTRISQCIGNLLHNASTFTEPGREIALSVAAEGDEAVVRVRDPGAGIEPDLLPHVFDLYAHGVRWVNGTQSGLGLGLKLVRNLVGMHGGRVEAHSAGVGQGAEFVIRLPLRLRQKPRGPEDAPAPAAQPAHGLRVMVVDDNVDAASSLAEVLAIWGHEVVEVHDGSSALRAAQDKTPDVVILDLSMPDMDGHEVARRLTQHPHRSRMRVVALSGYGQAQDRARTAQEGFDDHLVKPVDFAGLERYLAERAGPGQGAGLG